MRMAKLIGMGVLALALLFLTAVEQGWAEDVAEEYKEPFVDLDGDGFDDNLDDSNGDGIPDVAAGVTETSVQIDQSVEDVFSMGATGGFEEIEELTNLKQFGKLKFTVRDLSCCRGGFDAGDSFGPGSGIGSGALSGVCVGGVCF